MRRIIVVTRGGAEAGFGHLRRSLTLAEALTGAGADVSFVLIGNARAAALLRDGFDVVQVEGPSTEVLTAVRARGPTMVIVDSNDMRNAALAALRLMVARLGLIDDLADRDVRADLIVNGLAFASTLPYPRRPGTTLLLGPAYALLRREFAAKPDRAIPPVARRLLITLGGSDPWQLTRRVAAWARATCPDLHITAVVGPFFPEADVPDADELVVGPADMHALMIQADLAVSGGGQTTYELSATGTPTLAIEMAPDQERNIEALAEAGVLVPLGRADDPGLESTCRQQLAHLADAADVRARMSRAGRALVDGLGADRVATAVLGLL